MFCMMIPINLEQINLTCFISHALKCHGLLVLIFEILYDLLRAVWVLGNAF